MVVETEVHYFLFLLFLLLLSIYLRYSDCKEGVIYVAPLVF